MGYKINGIEVSKEILNNYFDSLVNKIFAILGIYEDCEETHDFTNYDTYLDRIIIELSGGYYVIGFNNFISLSNILSGIKHSDLLEHKKVKSLVFHCISIIKKMKIPENGDVK